LTSTAFSSEGRPRTWIAGWVAGSRQENASKINQSESGGIHDLAAAKPRHSYIIGT
jgi:hypothetical protein